jgi:predicted dehydrogenase
MLKVGILGMGGMGRFHASRYLELPDVELVAVADQVFERLLSENVVQINIGTGEVNLDNASIAKYSDATTLIHEADVDIVDICLPTDLHAEYAVKALNLGKHVLCEKPMALSVLEADKMIHAARYNQRKLMIAQVLRFRPEYIFLRECINTESFGALHSINMWRIGTRPSWSTDNWYLDSGRSGGMILDLHIHDVDYINSIYGIPDGMHVSGHQTVNARNYDVIHAVFSYKNGPQVHMHAGWTPAAIPFTTGFEAWFEKAFVRFADSKLDVYGKQGLTDVSLGEWAGTDGYHNEIAYFLDCVQNHMKLKLCFPESTRDSIWIIEKELDYLRQSKRNMKRQVEVLA